MFTIKEIIKEILLNNFDARDDDFILLWEVWNRANVMRLYLHNNEPDVLLLKKEEFYEHRLIDPISIRRCRQMLQQFNPGLRGKYYLQRHNRSKEIKHVVNDERWKEIQRINEERKEKTELERINYEISLILNAEKEFPLNI